MVRKVNKNTYKLFLIGVATFVLVNVAVLCTQVDDITKKGFKPDSHTLEWLENHKVAAVGDKDSCLKCHTSDTSCLDCHKGKNALRPENHEAGYIQSHKMDTYSNSAKCYVCHAQNSCTSCHDTFGVTVKESINENPHEAGWLVFHQQVAPYNLNSCATCHQASYCQRCHDK